MRTDVVALPSDATVSEVAGALASHRAPHRPPRGLPHAAPLLGRHDQRLFPLVDAERRLMGVVPRSGLRVWLDGPPDAGGLPGVAHPDPVVAFGDEPLRVVAFRMAETGVTRLPVVERGTRTLIGMIGLSDLLTARARILDAEQRRERVLGTRVFGRPTPSAS